MNKVSQSNDKLCFSISTNNSFYVKPKNQEDTFIYLYVSLLGQELKTKHQNPPLNISVVLDRSGSMSGAKLDYSKKAINFIIDNLKSQDNLSLIMYDDYVDLLSKSQKVENKEILKQIVDKIEVAGCTNLSGGMLEGYAQVQSTYDSKLVNRVLLLSDGLANVGITDLKELEKIARYKNLEEGMSLSTFGVGNHFNEDLMTGIANEGNGNYYFIESPEQIPTIFKEELQGLLSVVTQNTSLTLSLPSEVSLDTLFGGYPYQENGKDIVLNFNDIFAQEEKGILLKLKVEKEFSEKIDFSATLSYDDAENFQRKSIQQNISVKQTTDQEIFDKHKNEEVIQKKILFESNAQTDKILDALEKGDYDNAKELIRHSQETIAGELEELNEGISEQSILTQRNTLDDLEILTERKEQLKGAKKKAFKATNYQLKRRKL
ncbi:MAG: VWA domain-containing protein [Cytophagales bacterium]|nr:VWA domain-containing protein [Cytophagales bacterium]